MSPQNPLLFIPTYNEKENVRQIHSEILALGLNFDFLFLDDASPDGTGKILDAMAQEYPNIRVIHRSGKLGIGSAHMDGIRWAYQQGYKTLITMDCDFTHSPDYISEFLNLAKTKDVVVGSRYMELNSLPGWNLYRKSLTSFGHVLTKYMLKMEYDATGAFRVYHLDKIPLKAFERVRSKGYAFFFESLYILNFNGFTIGEVPIKLPARMYGHSKMTTQEIVKSVKMLFTLYVDTVKDRARFDLRS
jgi:dolichol-phosphate mannosyltransferase